MKKVGGLLRWMTNEKEPSFAVILNDTRHLTLPETCISASVLSVNDNEEPLKLTMKPCAESSKALCMISA